VSTVIRCTAWWTRPKADHQHGCGLVSPHPHHAHQCRQPDCDSSISCVCICHEPGTGIEHAVTCCPNWNGSLIGHVEESRPYIETRALALAASVIRDLILREGDSFHPEAVKGMQTAADLVRSGSLTLGAPIAGDTDIRNAQIRAVHRRRPMWADPEEWDHNCPDMCEDASHPHGKVVGYVCAECRDWDEVAQTMTHRPWPCRTIQALDGQGSPNFARFLALLSGTALGHHVERTTGATFQALAEDALHFRGRVAWLHYRYGLYETADQCRCNRDRDVTWDANHFEADDGGVWLCRLGTVQYVCYTCRDEEGNRVPWVCDTAVAAGLLDDSITCRMPPALGDAFEDWLLRQRDQLAKDGAERAVLDNLLSRYRFHAETGTPLSASAQRSGSYA